MYNFSLMAFFTENQLIVCPIWSLIKKKIEEDELPFFFNRKWTFKVLEEYSNYSCAACFR